MVFKVMAPSSESVSSGSFVIDAACRRSRPEAMARRNRLAANATAEAEIGDGVTGSQGQRLHGRGDSAPIGAVEHRTNQTPANTLRLSELLSKTCHHAGADSCRNPNGNSPRTD
jgi:hypothetical protein